MDINAWFTDEQFSAAQAFAMAYSVKFIMAIAIFVIGKWLARKVSNLVCAAMTKNKVDATIVSFTGNLAFAALLVVVIIASLGQLGIQTASFVAIIGAAGLAVGLALQGSLSNFAAGVLILLFRPFKLGDVINAAGHTGKVSDIHIFNTELTTGDNCIITIPNSDVTGGAITNFSRQDTRRLEFIFGVAYDADLKLAEEVIRKTVLADSRVLPEPAALVAVSELADNSVNFIVRPWVKAEDYWDVRWAIPGEVKVALDAANIGIPFPQLDLHIQQTEATSGFTHSISGAKQTA